MARHDDPWKGAFRVAVTYLTFAIVWILVSDAVVETFVPDPETQARVQTMKGSVFVVVSALVILGLVFRELRALRRVEDRHRVLVDQALAGIYVIRKGRFLFVNPRLAEIFGYEPDELVSSVGVTDVLHPADRELVLGNLRRREEGEVDETQYRFTGLRKDGEAVRVEVQGRRLDWDGEPAVMGALLDVTRRERLEEELRQSQRLEALGRVTGAVVHDFNNFLTAIVAPIELHCARLDPEDRDRADLLEAKASARRAVALTRKLLAFSRGKAYQTRRIALSDLVRRLEPILARLCGGEVELVLELEDELPPVELDPNGFEQVLVNLVVNAREANARRVGIRVAAAPPAGPDAATSDVRLEIEDDGDGMDEDTRTRAVEPFFSTKDSGSGLGLATVHGIVTQSKGVLEIESEPGRGTTFRIVLPGVEGPAEPIRDEGEEAPEEEAAEGIEGATVLVVDDDAAVRRVITRVLGRYGAETLEASDGERALALAQERKGGIDLVVTDLGLPDIDGVRLVARLGVWIPEAAVLYVSGQSTEEVLERVADERGRRILEKPFTVEGLRKEAAAALTNPHGTGRIHA